MIIGIIGGNGVAATNKLNELLELEFTKNGAFRDCHHPEIITYQATKAPSRSMFLEGRGDSFVPDYIAIAKKLEYCGATKLCMCCNTAHYAIDEIQKNVNIPFINLIEEVAKEVLKRKCHKVGLMVSDGCLKYKIYDKYFKMICPNVEIVYPDEEHQKLVTQGICNVKNSYRFESNNSKNRPHNIFKKVSQHLLTPCYNGGGGGVIW